jgi:thiamine pyrophosphate-dependent acetolactate synthase large subunit-like protein
MDQKLSDYVVECVRRAGVRHVFLVPGGGAMHLNDSLGRSGLELVHNHHEQASAIGCEVCAKMTGGLGAAFVTTGSGGTNAVTGLAGAWLDSTPCIFLRTGQRILHTTALGAMGFAIPSAIALREDVREVLAAKGPVVCNVAVIQDEDRLPRIASRPLPGGGMVSTPLEDLFPYPPRAEFLENMTVAPLEDV